MRELVSGEHVKKSTGTFWPVSCAIAVSAMFLVGAFAHVRSNDNTPWILLLFFLPVAGQLTSFWYLSNRVSRQFYNFNVMAATTCVLGYCIIWLVFSLDSESPTVLTGFSWLSLFLITVLLLLVIWMTAAIMKSSDAEAEAWHTKYSESLRAGIQEHPLWALCLFFTLFLGVTYLFGFAFAFHDRAVLQENEKAPALRMECLDSADDAKESGGASGGRISGCGGAAPSAENKQTGATLDESEKFFFYFASGEARLNRETYDNCDPLKPPKKDNKDPTKLQFNDCYLQALKKRIEAGTTNGNRVRIILIGHGDDAQIDDSARKDRSRYRSNYELSEARVHNVAFEILQALEDSKAWHNVEWVTLASSNESIPQIDINSKEEDKRVVIASVLPIPDHLTTLDMRAHQNQFKVMKLMDYMYFSVYTITTTGYGDIVPTTAYAKFVASLANICEVLFLVVFFNAIISMKGSPPPPPPSKKEKDDGPQDSPNVLDIGGRPRRGLGLGRADRNA